MRIAVLLGGTLPYSWRVAAGAIEYGIQNDVQILLPCAQLAGDTAKDPANWDGIIVRTPHPDLDIPQVSVSLGLRGNLVSATFDEALVAKAAVDQFAAMGLSHLAFYGRPEWTMSQVRWKHFSQQVKELGIEPVFINVAADKSDLTKIPKPCGILAFNDELALQFLDRCRRIGLRVPGDVYVISIDDTSACLQSDPTLSSISMPFHTLGFHAARLCAEMVRGASVASLEIPPSGIIIRDSSKFKNDDIKTASEIAHYLRAHLSDPIQMLDIVQRSSMSRRRLEQIFRSVYGSSPMAYLKEHRLEHAKEMLRAGDTSVKDIATACGYRDSNQICRVFKERVGLTPQGYRETHGKSQNDV